MDLIGRWLASKEYFDIHELEKIRGKLNSWLIVIPMLRLFIREQNAIIQKAYETNNFYQGEHEFDMKKHNRKVTFCNFEKIIPTLSLIYNINLCIFFGFRFNSGGGSRE